ncbi:conserved hypothetical protein 698 [Candidatus Koribacter versatilis Ellin345]|uniref:Sulfate exporter family transporter n=2 Tax=Candidatus Korobacter versatilis TaxID=658062 RepID=Q1IIG1_KORVE|nr:conserved hypothetical protein 698 [Candidatus Koribacter versatilis Ellin345]
MMFRLPMSKILFFALLLFSATPWASPPIALLCGLIFAFLCKHPFADQSKAVTRYLLQISVVGLGFGMNLQQVIRAGRSGFLYTALGITFAMLCGWALGKLLQVEPRHAFLISTGTAICGGSAIAAVGPVANATDDEMSVSLGTIFILNSIALLIFPTIGTRLHMTQNQFGLWAALAIHDTSSVVGASAKYGAIALAIGTTVKLARALWIVPMTLATSYVVRRQTHSSGQPVKIAWPWFILFFCLAAVANTYLPRGATLYHWLNYAAKLGLDATLFLIGASLAPASLKRVGVRPLLHGILLWLIVGSLSLLAIRSGWISI